jgi:CheY-like chemotaxis protein
MLIRDFDTDISMPVMDGLEASRQIRLFDQESKRDRVPIVALTGAASESARQEAFSAGIDHFLTKPVSLKVLRDFVDQYDLLADMKAGGK